MGKVKEMFMEFDELVESDSFFVVSIRQDTGISALGYYEWELDLYLMQKGFRHFKEDKFHVYDKGNIQISLV